MGLACSVLGHRYGDREHVEERERQGSEEITEIREVKTCERCGEELVVSETKEVLAVEEETEPAAPDPEEIHEEPETDAEPPEEPVATEIPEAEVDEEDEGVILREPEDREPGEWLPVEEESEASDEEAEEDIAWPDPEGEQGATEDEEPDDSTPWPEVEGEDEGFDAAEVEADPELAARVIESSEDTSETAADGSEDGFTRAESIDAPTAPDGRNVHTEFFCPQCDWTARALTTSVRRGDICPECRAGYIGEREA